MHFPRLTALLSLIALSITALAFPAPASVPDTAALNTAAARCESQIAHCLSLRTSLQHCRVTVCSQFSDECNFCRANEFPSLSPPTSPSTSTSTLPPTEKKRKAEATKPRNKCILICSHATCNLLCSNPGSPPSAADGTANTDTDTDDNVTIPLPQNSTTLIAPMDLRNTSSSSSEQHPCGYLCSTSSSPSNAECNRTCWTTSNDTNENTDPEAPSPTPSPPSTLFSCILHSPQTNKGQTWFSCPLPPMASTSRLRLKPKPKPRPKSDHSSSKPGFFLNADTRCEVGGGVVPRVRCWGV